MNTSSFDPQCGPDFGFLRAVALFERARHHGHRGFHGHRGPWFNNPAGDQAFESREDGENSMNMHNRGWRGGHHGRDGGDFGPGRGRGRGMRPFEQGDLRWIVLDLIAAQPRHGYELIKAIEDEMNGQYAPSPGIVYPTLTFLEETGLVSGEVQASKKLYSITEEGRAALTENAAALEAVKSRIEAFRSRFGPAPAPEMMRAMDNLRGAISVRLSKGELSPEALSTITAALDRAAGEIERS